eukprot:UN05732
MTRQYNWNPYQDHNKDESDNLDAYYSQVPESYRQGGWGMQVHPRWNSRWWKVWPSQRLLKRAVNTGRNVESAHLLYNPLVEGGQKKDDLAGDSYIDIYHPPQSIPEHDPEEVP